MDGPVGDVTALLHEINGRQQASAPELFSLLYHDLHRLAASYMRKERPDHTLQATALVHEVYIRLFQGEPFRWENRKQVFGTIAQLMRNLLVDHARRHRSNKRGGGRQRLSLEHALIASENNLADILAVDEALNEMGEAHERQLQVTELRFFAGLTIEETAAVLGISPETVKLDWRFVKAWLGQRMAPR